MTGIARRVKIWSVYIMAAPAHCGGTYFKVGRTSDIVRRVCGVQTGCPLKIQKAWAITLWDNGASQRLEAAMHEMLRPFHSHGEWFFMRTDNLEHKAAMNEAMDFGSRYASQMSTVKWRALGIAELRKAVADYNAEKAGERRAFEARSDRRALLAMATRRRQIL